MKKVWLIHTIVYDGFDVANKTIKIGLIEFWPGKYLQIHVSYHFSYGWTVLGSTKWESHSENLKKTHVLFSRPLSTWRKKQMIERFSKLQEQAYDHTWSMVICSLLLHVMYAMETVIVESSQSQRRKLRGHIFYKQQLIDKAIKSKIEDLYSIFFVFRCISYSSFHFYRYS